MTGIAASQHVRQKFYRPPHSARSLPLLLTAAILALSALPSQALVAEVPPPDAPSAASSSDRSSAPAPADDWLFLDATASTETLALTAPESAAQVAAADAVAVAEPSTGVLLVLGLLGLIWIRHRI